MQIVKTVDMKGLFMLCIIDPRLQPAFSASCSETVILKRRGCILYLSHSSSVAFSSSVFLTDGPAGARFIRSGGSELKPRAEQK